MNRSFLISRSFLLQHLTVIYAVEVSPPQHHLQQITSSTPIFIKQIQCFANNHNLCSRLSNKHKVIWQVQNSLRENAKVWTNICIVSYNRLDFLTRAVEKVSADGAVGQYLSKTRNTSLTFTNQCAWTGYYLYN